MRFSIDKSGLTMIEMIIVIMIISIWIIGIMSVVDYGLSATSQIRNETIATNLAREWMEGFFNIRETNRKRWSWVRDECWILKDPLGYDNDCKNEERIQEGNYILKYKKTWDEDNQYPYLEEIEDSELEVVEEDIDDEDIDFILDYDSDTWSRENNPLENVEDIEDRSTPEGLYFRKIDVSGLYDLSENEVGWEKIECDSWDDNYNGEDCGNWEAKELRFCSRVQYVWERVGEIELCSSVTNFRE